MRTFLFCLAAYLAGSLNFSLLVTSMLGRGDLRRYGSGNPGATNAFRTLGLRWAMLIVVLDAGRGFLIVFAATSLLGGSWPTVLGCLAVVAGNLFPVYHGFRGGKGFATTLGIFIGLEPVSALVVACVWLVAVLIFRMASVGSLAAAALFPILLALRGGRGDEIILALILLVVTITTHRRNIRRLRRGYEHRLGK
jgi:acyl phosphate:glycerol-3-phosphate acyltransferase